ncbi:MAG TPA: hypothetical protein VEC01_11190 [Noviherbaspirillum sp.]|uniref:hypothetical protein n=1 Tax=Noviherbaspirillum sp. TaxID=1926288 RepID=UPI002D485405|nr:hypothetical protein [Noviherbaspirillum sp.]HYD95881.1 hypothetical protein [Noviherbaspirillum sp.]
MMNDLENSMDPSAMEALAARTLYTLRETRKALLRQHGVAAEEELLDKIRRAEAAEHPTYEHYLGAKIIEQARMQLREELLAQSRGAAEPEVPELSVHLAFQAKLEEQYGERLSEPVRMAQDALLLSFDNGVMMEVRYFSADEYCIRWAWGEADFCIDTAPVHPGLPGAPVHLHRDDGTTVEWTMPAGPDCWTSFSALLDILLADPLLEAQAGRDSSA